MVINALEKAFRVAKSQIYQGCPFTSQQYIDFIEENGICQSMDGKSRWADNIMTERWLNAIIRQCCFPMQLSICGYGDHSIILPMLSATYKPYQFIIKSQIFVLTTEPLYNSFRHGRFLIVVDRVISYLVHDTTIFITPGSASEEKNTLKP